MRELNELEILEAISVNRLTAFYQPQYDAYTEKMTGAEALARIVNSDGTVVSPYYFVPRAEKSDTILDIDWHILETVCDFIATRKLNDKPPIKVAVNFSRRHLREQDFAGRLKGTVDKYGVDPKYIIIEITESFLSESGDVKGFISDIRKLGFSVSVDDFGSGLSSLGFVKDIETGEIKIDKSLMLKEHSSDKERAVLESIMVFAGKLNCVTVAEGVETEEQLGFLRACGCNYIQGYIFSKPLSAKDFSALLDETPPEESFDLLKYLPAMNSDDLVMQALYKRYPLIILANLSKDSYYMKSYDSFTRKSCMPSGRYSDLIESGAATLYPDDKKKFLDTFRIENMLKANEAGKSFVSVTVRQLGDDGKYRSVENIDYFVKSPDTDDVLVVALCRNLED
ncbi:MAG: EAL domain-containing protein [Saccharofermentans sp.]|nr:EAL domain-containing protein [Saccharofermentans sp.]